MNAINLEDARKDFCGTVAVGEYVAWWIVGDKRFAAMSNSLSTIWLCVSMAELLYSPCADDTLEIRVIVDGSKA